MATALMARRRMVARTVTVTVTARDLARERDWARWEFRCHAAERLAIQGVDWPAVTVRETPTPSGGVAMSRHYALPPVAPRASWWQRLLYGPQGRRRV